MANDTRARIVAVARDLIHGASLAEVSIEDVCVAAGVHRGSLYHFFVSKEALGIAVLDANWVLMQGVLDEAFQAEVEPLERIGLFIGGFAAMLRHMRQQMGSTPGCPLGGLTAELAAHPGPGRDRAAAVLDAWAAYFTDAITEARVRGHLDQSIEPRAAATRILAYLQGLALLAKVHDQPNLLATARDGVRMLLRPAS